MLKNNLISLLDTGFPDVNRLFSIPPRADGSEEWVDFVASFWHCEYVSSMSKEKFITQYSKWCQKHRNNLSEKTSALYELAMSKVTTLHSTPQAKALIVHAISPLTFLYRF